MATLTISSPTIDTRSQVTRPVRTQAVRTATRTAPRPGFWLTLLRALSTAAA